MQVLTRYERLAGKFDPKKVIVKKSIRVNTLKISEAELVKRLKAKKVKLTKVPFVKNGYYYESDFSLGSTPEYLQGYYYLQEAASQVPAELLDPKPGERVLDMAASPGGKTTQLAALMQNKGVIIALESEHSRIKRLVNNIERLSAANIVVYKKDARYAPDFKLAFDKILLDAPCSGNFCVEKDYFLKRSFEDFRQRSRLQKELLLSAARCLKTGGTLVYSTCSLEPEEDEMVIDWLLEERPEMELVETGLKAGDPGLTDILGEKLNPELSKARRFWPHKTGTEGFFIAKLIKK